MNTEEQSITHAIGSAEVHHSDDLPWYAVRIFQNKHKRVVTYLQDKHLDIFIPQHYVDHVDASGHIRHELRPVVYNLVFVRKTMTTVEMHGIVAQSNLPFYVLRTERGGRTYYEISAREMQEFQQMCNPDIAMRHYLSETEARLKPGAKVLVTHGPLKGITGRLVRISKKYFLLKEVPGMGIALKVSKWYCQQTDD